MEINIQSIHFNATAQLEAFIQKKVAKLDKYCDGVRKVDVTLKVVKPETSLNKQAGLRVYVQTTDFYVEKVCDTFEEAIDTSVDSLVRQLVKFKEKQQAR